MNRRKALKSVAVTFGSLLSLPAWANGWTAKSLPKIKNSTTQNANVLNQLVEALIPKTETPGAGEMGVEKFVLAMVNDCTSETQRSIFMTQLGKIDEFSKAQINKFFAESSADEKTVLIRAMSKSEVSEWKSFFGILKRFTIQGYLTSEFVMNAKGFQFAPGYYHGCVDLVQ